MARGETSQGESLRLRCWGSGSTDQSPQPDAPPPSSSPLWPLATCSTNGLSVPKPRMIKTEALYDGEVTPPVLRAYSFLYTPGRLGDHLGCSGLNPGQLHAGQAPYLPHSGSEADLYLHLPNPGQNNANTLSRPLSSGR